MRTRPRQIPLFATPAEREALEHELHKAELEQRLVRVVVAGELQSGAEAVLRAIRQAPSSARGAA